MPADTLIELLGAIEAADIPVWLDGGWGVDALLGHQTRVHADADLVLALHDVPSLRTLLEARGFAEQPDGRPPHNFVMADADGHELDLHAVEFDASGSGHYCMAAGDDWVYPAAGFDGHGIILGRAVHCLSPEVQVLCHASGYVTAAKDRQDMALLATRFGVQLPPTLQSPM